MASSIFYTTVIIITTLCIANNFAINLNEKYFSRIINAYLNDGHYEGIVVYQCSEENSMNGYMEKHTKVEELTNNNTSINQLILTQSIIETRLNVAVFLNLSCNRSYEILKKSSERKLFNLDYRWLLWSRSYTESVRMLSELNISIDSSITLAILEEEGCSNCLTTTFYDVYKVHYKSKEVISNVAGLWSLQAGFTIYDKQSRNDFRGWQINAGHVLMDLLVSENVSLEMLMDIFFYPDKIVVPRYSLVLFLDLRRIYNFTYNYTFVDSWGYNHDDKGYWNGLAGLLERGEVDVSFSHFNFRSDRMGIMKYYGYYFHTKLVFVYIQPAVFGRPTALITPFSKTLWFCLGTSVILISLTMWIISKWDEQQTEKSYIDNLSIAVGHIAQQGPDNSIGKLSSHIVFLILYLFAFFIFNYYSAAVLNGILSPVQSPINSLKKLLESDMRLGVADYAYLRDQTEKGMWGPKNKLRIELEERLKADNIGKHSIYYGEREGAENVKKGKFAFVTTLMTFYKDASSPLLFTDSEICNLKWFPHQIPKLNVGGALPKNSPYTEFFTINLIKEKEVGMITRQLNLFFYRYTLKCDGHTELVTISVPSMSAALFILLFGFIISFIILLVEVLKQKI